MFCNGLCWYILSCWNKAQRANRSLNAAYLGLVPIERQSGTSVKGRPRLSKAGDSRARATLYLPALVAARCNPHIRALYERLIANGKCKMAALGACRHVIPITISFISFSYYCTKPPIF
jgi:transposase